MSPPRLFVEQPLWRPLKRATLMLDHQLWGRAHPAGFHASNVAFHALACLALYRLARRLAGPTAGLVAGLLFATHPVHVEAVANISHRKEPMSLLFLLVALLLYVRGRDSGRGPGGGGGPCSPRRARPGAPTFPLFLSSCRRARLSRSALVRAFFAIY